MEPIELGERLGRWSSARGPLYVLLAARLRELIDGGELPAGVLLPPERTLAAVLAVGRSTVVAAYERLRADGRIVRRQGSGTRVAGEVGTAGAEITTAPMFLHHLEARADDVILFACAAPDGPPPEVARAYARVVPELAALSGDIGYYPSGHPRLRAAIAARYTAQGIPTVSDQILVTNGGQQALSLIAACLVSPGDAVLVEAPTYPGALEAFREAAAVLRPLPVGLVGFADAVRAHRPALAYLIPRFHNPTGAVLPAAEQRRIAEVAAAEGVPLVIDDVAAELGFPGAQEFPVPLGDTAITVGSLSKVVWGGLRIGWIRAVAPAVARLARLRAVHDIGGDTPAQLAAAALVGDLDAIRDRQAADLQVRHDRLLDALSWLLPQWSVHGVRGGQTLWARLPYGDGDSFAQQSLRCGVAVLPGSGLDVSGASDACVRLHFRLPPERQEEAVRRLARAWHEYRPPAHRAVAAPALAI
ncbi:PLP-dependent aminotransferase family protein [Pseudonocardia sp. GCM10023141]|uniref:aminotransferase-like domain-containing protein n=1 Tax=Pseudonocardia sp. GCM10023141 TaxID=3252653 RepID=UPI003614753B